MIRLSYVKFKHVEKFTKTGASSDEVNTDMHGEIYRDHDIIKVGKDEFPISNVRKMIPMAPDQLEGETCPECQGYFQDKRALGAHRYFKHNIGGKRPPIKEVISE
jgi:hypothetical protein